MPSFRKFIAAGAILVGIGLVPAAANAQGQADIVAYTSADLNLREGPGTDFRIITAMPLGAEVRILYCETSVTWCYLQYRQYVGWGSSRYLTQSPPQYAQQPPYQQYPQQQYPQQQYPQYPQQQYPQYPQQQYPQYPQYPQQAYQPPPPPPPPQQYVVVPPQQPNVVVVQPSPYPYYWASARFGLWLNFLFR